VSHTKIISAFAADQRHRQQSVRLTKELQTVKPDHQSEYCSGCNYRQTPRLDQPARPAELAGPDDSAIVTDIITGAIEVGCISLEREPLHSSIPGKKCAGIEPIPPHSQLTKGAIAGGERLSAHSTQYSVTHQRKD
jgi:hypothetical protein